MLTPRLAPASRGPRKVRPDLGGWPRRAAGATVLAVALALSSCATVEPEREQRAPLYFPSPPAPARLVYEMVLRSPRDLVLDEDAATAELLIGPSSPRVVYEKPFDVAARNGRIYISDTVAGLVHVFDVPRRRYFQIGVRRAGQIVKPMGIALDGASRVYVADIESRAIHVYDRLGLYLKRIGGPEDFAGPSSVAVNRSGDRIYVVDNGGIYSDDHRVVAFDDAGDRLFAIGRRGDETGEFFLPTDAAVAPDGTLYVLDSGNFRVQAFDAEGRFLRHWGANGARAGLFARPRQIAVDDRGSVYVSDAGFGNIQIFSPRGDVLFAIGRFGQRDEPARFAVIAGVTIDETGRLYVVDQFFRKVEIYRFLSGPMSPTVR